MKRFSTLLNRTKSSNNIDLSNAPADSPQANASQAIRQFCESSSDPNTGDEAHVLHLPVIVEAAESSPQAATAAAQQIRTFLSKDWTNKPHVQYHAIMLIRILSDNPGPSFTRNFDKQFVSTVKDCLKNSKDRSTQQILRETLDSLEVNKPWDEGLKGLLDMWRNQKGHKASLTNTGNRRVGPPTGNAQYHSGPVYGDMSRNQMQQHNSRPQLPPLGELASRIEESRNTAKILLQLIASTPTEEVLQNDLIKEFGERCQSAQKSIQAFVHCDNPSPDHDTMQTLIETNEQLSLANSRHHRAILAARRALGAASPTPSEQQRNISAFGAPASPSPQQREMNGSAFRPNGNEQYQPPPGPPPNSSFAQRDPMPQIPALQPSKPMMGQQEEPANPFADPEDHENLAIEPKNYGSSGMPAPQRDTMDLENAYNDSPAQQSAAPVRPGPGPYHTSSVRPSYMNRQSDAANATTMHGAQAPETPELDSNADVGRRAREQAAAAQGSAAPTSFSISHEDSRA